MDAAAASPATATADVMPWVMRGCTASLLLIIGLTVRFEAFWSVLRPSRNGLFLPAVATLASVVLVVPSFAALLILAFHLDGPSAVALFLFATAPGGSFSNVIASAAGAQVELNAALTTLAILASFGLMPVACGLALPALMATGRGPSSGVAPPVTGEPAQMQMDAQM